MISAGFPKVDLLLTINLVLILMLSEMVERGGYTSLDLLDGDCVLRPQVIQYHRKNNQREKFG